ncbi:MAG: alpha-E domain-containing protein [Acidimicrobiales bacterium]|nr:alpha-E domain-containing protein [Acidimicrobiales bacterium]
MTLLCRTAEHLYWMGRYLERAEQLTRLVREHTVLITDLPVSAGLGWDSLLAIPGETGPFFERYDAADEASVVTYLLADQTNPSSLVWSLRWARENLRTTRSTMPRGTWRIVNELAQYVASSAELGCLRGRRHEFCERVVSGCQRLSGFLAGSMGRDPAWDFYQLGVQLERADMTSRVLDVRAGGLVAAGDEGDTETFRDTQWVSLLSSLDGLQLYRRVTRSLVEGDRVVGFVLNERQFPRSVGACLTSVSELLAALPDIAGAEDARVATVAARARLDQLPATGWTHTSLHDQADDIQLTLAGLDRMIVAAYFRLEGAGPAAETSDTVHSPTQISA